MERVKTLQALAPHLGRVLSAAKPVQALRAAGVELDPELLAKVGDSLNRDPLGLEGRLRAAVVFGPTVPMRLSIGPSAGPAPADRAAARGAQVLGFDIAANGHFSSLDTLLAELWNGHAYPQDLPARIVKEAIDIDTLRANFTGVPDGAGIGVLLLPEPPKTGGARDDVLATRQPLRLRVDAPGGTVELIAVATVNLPVVPRVSAGAEGSIDLDLSYILERTTVSLAIEPGSAVQPRSADHLHATERVLSTRLGKALAAVTAPWRINRNRKLPGVVSNSVVYIDQPRVWLLPDRMAVGVLVEAVPQPETPRPAPDRARLAELPAPDPDYNFRVAVSELAIETCIRAAIKSGDIAAHINKKFGSIPLAPTIAVDDGRVTVDEAAIHVELDCRAINACPAWVDLDFRMTVHLDPVPSGPRLRLLSNGIDLNLDNTDAAYCLLTGGLSKIGALLMAGGLALMAFCTPKFNKSAPGSWMGARLPRSELFPYLELRQAETKPGFVDGQAVFILVPDDQSTFVYVQVVRLDGPEGTVSAVEGVKVELLELGTPPPEGDDLVVPEDWTRTDIGGKIMTTHSAEHSAIPDIALASATTERHGLAQLVTGRLSRAGYLRTYTRVEEDLVTGDEEVHSQTTVEGGDLPDLALRVTLSDGTVAIPRQLIALNFTDRRIGSIQEPLRVVLPPTFTWPGNEPEPRPCQAETAAVEQARSAVDSLQEQLKALEKALRTAPREEKEQIQAEIRQIQRFHLPAARTALERAERVLEQCRQRSSLPGDGALRRAMVDPPAQR